MNVPISETWHRFVREEVESGRFPTEAAVVEEALALLSETERRHSAPGSTGETAARPIGEVIDGLMSGIPQDVLDRLPEDGAAQHDHYIYGTPRRPT
jgi:Arc/MetJ-type ribon-helix-helix transcriptional regulator